MLILLIGFFVVVGFALTPWAFVPAALGLFMGYRGLAVGVVIALTVLFSPWWLLALIPLIYLVLKDDEKGAAS